MNIPAKELRRRVQEDNARIALDATVGDAVEAAYRRIDWNQLSEAGFDKRGDYCFIYSYPPVRVLKECRRRDVRRSDWNLRPTC